MIQRATSPLSVCLLILALTGVLAGCAGRPEPEPEPPETTAPPENPAIVMARSDLAAARALNAEWLVLEPRVAQLPVSLGEILAFAEEAQARGDIVLANDLAARVSRMARLGLVQAAEQQDAAPYYPQ